MAFNKPDVNEEELRALQRKKASYNAKVAKFEVASEEKKKMVSQAKVNAKMSEERDHHHPFYKKANCPSVSQ